MIAITETAATEVKKLIEAQSLPNDVALRLGVQGGGCAGLSYTLNFDTQQNDRDRVFDQREIKLLIDSKSYLFLSGTTLDYTTGANGGGFVFDNPNAAPSCGCGSSCGA